MTQESRTFLHQIYPEEGATDDAQVDIVAVHGLDPSELPGHAYNTWTANGELASAEGKLWLKDFLPEYPGIPKLRIFLFEYDSNTTFKASTIGIAGAANSLLHLLRSKRTAFDYRPVVFVCHSMGGIVVKQALVEAHNANEIHGALLSSARGIAFFGTPHREGHGMAFGDVLVRVAKALSSDVCKDTMENLSHDYFLTDHLQHNFRRRAKHLRVVNFMEALPITEIPDLAHYGLLLPQTPSTLGWAEPDEIQFLVQASHISMCKFHSNYDKLYISVAERMLELITWAVQSPQKIPNILLSEADPRRPPSHISSNSSSFEPHSKSSSSSKIESQDPRDTSSSDSDEALPEWANRVRASSPFRSVSPVPGIRSRKDSTESDISSKFVQSVWPIVMLPYQPNPSYVSRTDIWPSILPAMERGSFVCFHGISGSGKTQLAIYLAHWFREAHPDASIMWVNATSPEACLNGLRLTAARAGIRDIGSRNSTIHNLKRFLENPKSRRWLLVFDSADELSAIDSVMDLIPSCSHGQVVCTSRRRFQMSKSAVPEFTFKLDALTGEQSARLVHNSLRPALLNNIIPADMERFLYTLDYLPLAISQAVAFMNKHSVSIAWYLAKILTDSTLSAKLSRNQISEMEAGSVFPDSVSRNNMSEMPGNNPPPENLSQNTNPATHISNISPAVYSTCKASFENLQKESVRAIKLLASLSFLEENIPISLLQVLDTGTADFHNEINQLRDYSFVELSEDRDMISLHHSLQLATQRWLKETAQKAKCRQTVLSVLAHQYPDASSTKNRPQCESWLPHALKILSSMENVKTEHTLSSSGISLKIVPDTSIDETAEASSIVQLQTKVGFYYFKSGQYATASHHLESAVDRSRQSFGTMDDLTLDSQEKFIHNLRQVGHFARAFQNAEDLKNSLKAKLGRKHKHTLESYRLLAHTLQDLGRWADSLAYSEKALKGYRDLHKNDPSHEDVLRCCRRTATASEAMGNYAQAEKLLTEALRGYEMQDKAESWEYADIIFELSRMQVSLGKFEDAEKSARKSTELRMKSENKDHPEVLKGYWRIAIALLGRNEYEASEKILLRLLEQAETRPGFGPKHYYAYICKYWLARIEEGRAEREGDVVKKRERISKAKDIYANVFAGRTEIFGEDHLETLMTGVRLAGMEAKLGNLVESEKKLQEVLKVVTSKLYRKLGVASASIAWVCLENLWWCATENAKKLEALSLLGLEKQILQQRKMAVGYAKGGLDGRYAVLGKEHPDTVAAARVYLEALEAVGDGKMVEKVRVKYGVGGEVLT